MQQSNYKVGCVSSSKYPLGDDCNITICCPGTINAIVSGTVNSIISGGTLNAIVSGTVNSIISGGTLNTIVSGTVNSIISGGTLNTIVSGTVNVSVGSTSSLLIQNSNQVIGTVLIGNNNMNDAFSRLRVSNPITLFDSSMEVDDQPLLWDVDIIGSGTASYNVNQSSVNLILSASSSVVRQSHQYVRYQPGKSLLNLCSFALGARATDVTRRVGFFDSQNGIYLEQTDSDIYWVLRSFISGSVVETRIAQASWNIDPIDGSGQSGFTLDEVNTNLTVIDIEWLGVGRVRVGFFMQGRIIYAHQFTLSIPTAYMTRASLPVRYEILSGGSASGSPFFVQICSTVISEGGFDPKGMIRSIDIGNASRTVGASTYLPILAIRLKSTYQKASITPLNVQVVSSSGSLANYRLLVRANVIDGSWLSASEAVEYNSTGSTFSGGYQVAGGYVSSQIRESVTALASTTLNNSSDINGVIDEIVITASSFSGNIGIAGAIQWREIF